MQISIILAYPRAQSLNHAIADSAAEQLRQRPHGAAPRSLRRGLPAGDRRRRGRDVAFRRPAGGAALRRDRARRRHYHRHPNWWGQPPAILKGWVDRVLRPGVAYDWGPNDRGRASRAGCCAHALPWCSTRRTRPGRASRPCSATRSICCGATVSLASAASISMRARFLAWWPPAPPTSVRPGWRTCGETVTSHFPPDEATVPAL